MHGLGFRWPPSWAELTCTAGAACNSGVGDEEVPGFVNPNFAEDPSDEVVESPVSRARRPTRRPRDSSCCGTVDVCPGDQDDDHVGDMAIVDAQSVLPESSCATSPLERMRRQRDADRDARGTLPDGVPLGKQVAECCVGRKGEHCPSPEYARRTTGVPCGFQTMKDAGPASPASTSDGDASPSPFQPLGLHHSPLHAIEESDGAFEVESDEAAESPGQAASQCESDELAESPGQAESEPEGTSHTTAARRRKAGAPRAGARRKQGWPADMPDPSLWSFVLKRQIFQDGGAPLARLPESDHAAAPRLGDAASEDPAAAGSASEEKSGGLESSVLAGQGGA